jgi:hypothetical protein
MKTVTKCLPLVKPGTDIPEESKVLYRSKDGKNEKTFDALEWLAAMCSPCPLQRRASPTRENRWSDTTGITATSVGVNGRRQTRTD